MSRALEDARRKMERASERRRALPPGSSRARVTTANARWSTACEAYERLRREHEGRSLLADAWDGARRDIAAVTDRQRTIFEANDTIRKERATR